MANQFSDDLLLELKRLQGLRTERTQNPAAQTSLQAELESLNLPEIAATMGEARDPEKMSPTERALRANDFQTLEAMHGKAAADQLRRQFLQVHDQIVQKRDLPITPGEMAGNLASGVPGAAVGGVYGLGSLGLGVASGAAGLVGADGAADTLAQGAGRVAQINQDWERMLAGIQSDSLNAHREVDALRLGAIQRENQLDAEKMIQAGIPELLAQGIREAKNLGEGAAATLDDPSLTVQKASESLGSMYAGSALAKGLGALGRTAVATRLGQVASKVTPGVALKLASKMGIGAEGIGLGSLDIGDAYRSTMQSVLNQSTDELYQKSEPFREKVQELLALDLPQVEAEQQAKRWLANKAGLAAGAGAAVLAVPLAGTVGKGGIEPHGIVRSFFKDVGGEVLEEAGQESINALAQNLSNRLVVGDQSQDVLTGTGIAAGQAGVLGGLSAGAGKAPAALVNPTTLAAGIKAAATGVAATKQAASSVVKAAGAKGAAKQAELAQQASLSAESLGGRAQSLVENAPAHLATLHGAIDALPKESEENKALVKERLSAMAETLQVQEQPPIAAQLSKENQTKLAQAPNRVAAIQEAAKLLQTSQDLEEQKKLAVYLEQISRPLDSPENQQMTGLLPAMRNKAAKQTLREYTDLFSQAMTTPEVKAARQKADELFQANPVRKLTEADLNTEEGQQLVAQEVAHAMINPDAGSAENAALILKHAERLGLTPAQQTVLKGRKALLDAREKLVNQKIIPAVRGAKDEEGKPVKPVDLLLQRHLRHQLLSRQDAVEADLVAGRGQDEMGSARQYVDNIVSAMQGGDEDAAREHMIDLVNLARNQANKVEALNKHFQSGKREGYQAYPQLIPGKRKFLSSDSNPKERRKGMSVNPTKASSIEFAQQVGLEAQFLHDLAQSLIEEFPQLQLQLPARAELDPRLHGDAASLAQQFQKGEVKAESNQAEKIPASVQPRKELQEKQQTVLEDASEKAPEGVANAEAATRKVADQQQQEAAVSARPDEQVPLEAYSDAEIAGESVPAGDTAEVDSQDVVKIESREFTPEMTMEQAFGKRLLKRVQSLFTQVYRIRKAGKKQDQPAVRTFLVEQPANLIRLALSNADSLKALIGRAPKKMLDPAAGFIYRQLLSLQEANERDLLRAKQQGKVDPRVHNLGTLLAAMEDSLQRFLDEPYSTSATPDKQGRDLSQITRRELFADKELHKQLRGRALNIVEESETGELHYNQPLLQQALMAGLHWWLNASHLERPLDFEELENLTGREIGELDPEQIAQLSQGLSLEDAKQSLARTILRHWGVQSKANADLSHAEGIAESVAAEVIQRMTDLGMVERREVQIQEQEGERDFKTIHRYVARQLPSESPIYAYPDAIEGAVVVEPEETSFYGDAEVPLPVHQMGNRYVELGRRQIRAAENLSRIPHTLDLPYATMLRSLGREGVVATFGTPVDLTKPYNLEHKATLEGQNLTLTSAFDDLVTTMTEMESISQAAQTAGMDFALDQVEKKYAYGVTSVDRTMMLGRNNPMSSKLIRESVIATWSNLDLSDKLGEHYWGFAMSLAQALGIKVHNEDNSLNRESIHKVEALLAGPLAPAVALVENWLQDQSQPFPGPRIREVLTQTKVPVSFVGMHALIEWARYNQASEEARKNFRTSIYFEADGKTNGPFNALGLLSVGQFTREWVEATLKGGLRIGTDRAIPADRLDKTDLYATSIEKAKSHFARLLQTLGMQKQRNQLLQLNNNLRGVVGVLFPGGIKMSSDEQGNVVLELDRGVAKNPLTITVYGSGERGIANKLTKIITKELAARMTLAAQAVQENRQPWEGLGISEGDYRTLLTALEDITSQEVRYYAPKNEYSVRTKLSTEPSFKERLLAPAESQEKLVERFTLAGLTSTEQAAFAGNMHLLFVNPLSQGIQETMGRSIFQTRDMLVQATRIQSIVFRELYRDEIQRVLAEKAAKNPNFDMKRDFLSRVELDQIWDKLDDVAPRIMVDGQPFLIVKRKALETAATVAARRAGKKQNKTGANPAYEFGRAFDNTMRSGGAVEGPADAGVAVVPFLTIGMGDARMIRELFQQYLERSTEVYDGFNMPVDQIKKYGELANKAALDAWRTGNPIRGVEASFHRFLQNPRVQQLLSEDSAFRNELKEALHLDGAMGRPEVLAQTLALNLVEAADQMEARREVFRKVGMSMDQMAGPSAPYLKEGLTFESSDPQAIADELNKLYAQELPKVREVNAQRRAQRAEQIRRAQLEGIRLAELEARENLEEEALVEAPLEEDGLAPVSEFGDDLSSIPKIGVEGHAGVRLLAASGIQSLLTRFEFTPTQREMIGALLRSQTLKGYQVVFGSRERIRAWQQAQGLDSLPDQAPGEQIHGFAVPGEKRIYLMTGQTETLTHELIHAATAATVHAYYQDPAGFKNQPQVRDAILRLEKLMELFRETAFDTEGDPELESALTNILRQMNEWRDRPGISNADRKTGELNEFMAWALTNKALSEQLALTDLPAQVRKSQLFKLARAAFQAIRKLIFGAANAKLTKPGADVLSNLRFNTEIVIRAQVNLGQLLETNRAALVQKHAVQGDQPDLSRMRELREKLEQAIVLPVSQNEEFSPQLDVEKAYNPEIELAADLLTEAQVHFRMNEEEAATFKMVALTLATEERIAPNALAKVQELYAHFLHHTSPDIFVPEELAENNAEAIAYRSQYAYPKYNFIIGKGMETRDRQGRSMQLPIFLALALTSSEFRQALSRLPAPETVRVEGEGMDGMLYTLANRAMDSLANRVTGVNHPASVREALDQLGSMLTQTITEEHEALQSNFLENGVDWLNEKVVEGFEKASELADKAGDQLRAPGKNPIQRSVGTILKGFSVLVNEDKGEVVAESLISRMNKLKGFHALQEIVRSMVGRTGSNAELYDLNKKARSSVSQLRQKFRDELPGVIRKQFTRKLSQEENTIIHRVVGRYDLAALTDRMATSKALKLATDHNSIVQAAGVLEGRIKNAHPDEWPVFEAKIDQLVDYIQGKPAGVKLLNNPWAIAHLLGEAKPEGWQPSKGLIQAIDQLITLRLLDKMGETDRKTLSRLYREERNGLEFTLNYLKGLRTTEMEKIIEAGDRALSNYHKGALPTEQARGHLMVADDAEEAKWKLLGYQKLDRYEGSSIDGDHVKSYYFSPTGSYKAQFNQGVIQTVQPTAYGIHLDTGISTGHNAGVILNPARVAQLVRKLDKEQPGTENLIPIYEDGEVVGFERSVDPGQLKERVEAPQDLSRMLGRWAGRQLEESLAATLNDEALVKLHKMWVEAPLDRKEEFINLNSPEARLDPIRADAIKLLTPRFWRMAQEHFGNNEVWVRRDQLDDMLGARQASVGDVFTGITRWSPEVQKATRDVLMTMFGENAFRWMTKAERNWQALVMSARTNIVVRSLIVPAVNAASGILQLYARGVPVPSIVKGLVKKVVEVRAYTRGQAREVELDALIQAAENPFQTRKLEAELQALKDSYRSFSIWPLIQAGEFSTIASLGFTADDAEGISRDVTEWLAQKVNQLPPPVRSLARYGYLAKDTALFQGLQKAVQYSDFLMKAVYFDHLTRKKGLDKGEALGQVTEEYINYDLSTGRVRGAIEANGLGWFLNYKLRTPKVALSMLRKNPVHVLLSNLMSHPAGVDLPTHDNWISKLLSGTLGWSLGPRMMLQPMALGPVPHLIAG